VTPDTFVTLRPAYRGAVEDGPVWVIVVAAGRGARFGRPKQYEALAGRRVLDWSLAAARSVAAGVVLVVAPDRVADPEPQADVVVRGGDTRSASVRAGLVAVPDDAAVVLVHDAARPLASPELFARVVEAVRGGADAVVPVVAVADALRRRSGGVVDRDELVAVQTPQGFRAAALRAAHAGAPEATDDAALVEERGGSVVLVDGEPGNRKITDPSDLGAAEGMLQRCT
jgi:2-C-methyl-D-erythritol 4-phosphate cytidylyltransferase